MNRPTPPSPGRPTTDWAWPRPGAGVDLALPLARDLGPEGISAAQRGAAGRASPPRRSPGSSSSSRCGATRAPLGWDERTRTPPPAPSARSCPTSSRRPPGRSCTSTVASTRWGPEPGSTPRAGGWRPFGSGFRWRAHRYRLLAVPGGGGGLATVSVGGFVAGSPLPVGRPGWRWVGYCFGWERVAGSTPSYGVTRGPRRRPAECPGSRLRR